MDACVRSPRRLYSVGAGLRSAGGRFHGAFNLMQGDGNRVCVMMRSSAVRGTLFSRTLLLGLTDQPIPTRVDALIMRALKTQKGRRQDGGRDKGDQTPQQIAGRGRLAIEVSQEQRKATFGAARAAGKRDRAEQTPRPP